MKAKKSLNAPKEEGKKLRVLTEEELAQVNGGMDIGKLPPIEGLSILSQPGVAAEPGQGLDNLGGAVSIPSNMGIDPRSEAVANPFAHLSNVDALNRPPTPPSPVAESVKKAVDAALQNW